MQKYRLSEYGLSHLGSKAGKGYRGRAVAAIYALGPMFTEDQAMRALELFCSTLSNNDTATGWFRWMLNGGHAGGQSNRTPFIEKID